MKIDLILLSPLKNKKTIKKLQEATIFLKRNKFVNNENLSNKLVNKRLTFFEKCVEYSCGQKFTKFLNSEDIQMDFIIDLLNKIYELVVGILSAAGIDTTTFPPYIIPGGNTEE